MEQMNDSVIGDEIFETKAVASEKKPAKAPERVALSESEGRKLDHWIGLAREDLI